MVSTIGGAGGLAVLGLHPGEGVRWRSGPGGRWQMGVVSRRERDGSVGIIDARGATRSLPIDQIEVRHTGRRGGAGWEPLAERAGRSEQLRLL